MNRLETFMAARAAETYPEPRMSCHDKITTEMAPIVAKLIPPGGNVLDVGCGQGPALEWFADHGFSITGISLNQEDVDVCTAADYDAVLCDQNDLRDFRDATFDCVWARHVLEHSIAPFWTLSEFHRVLKSSNLTADLRPQTSGILYLEMPSPGTACHHETNRNHYSVLGLEMWQSLIARAGFEILEGRAINLTTPAGPDIYWSLICQKKSSTEGNEGNRGVLT